jgi:hypothetical protein
MRSMTFRLAGALLLLTLAVTATRADSFAYSGSETICTVSVSGTYEITVAGAQYLLLLKRADSSELTGEWNALSPTNEQLHSADDPWLIWVRAQSRRP